MPNEGTEHPITPEENDGHNEGDLRAFLDLLVGGKLGQTPHRFRGLMKLRPTLFRKGFRNFSQRHRWERKYYRRSCLDCNAQFVAKKSAVPTPMEDLWQDVTDHQEESGEGLFPESESHIVNVGGDRSGVSDTGSEAADEQIKDNESPAEVEGFCRRCQALRKTSNHGTSLPNAGPEAEPSIMISDVASNAASDGPVHRSRSGIGNIPTLEEAIRRQQIRVVQHEEPEPEPLWKSFLEWIVKELPLLIVTIIQDTPRIIMRIIFNTILLGLFRAIAALFVIFPLDPEKFGLGLLLELFDNLTFRPLYFVVRSIDDFSLRRLISSLLGAIKTLFKMVFQLFTLVVAGVVFSISAGVQLLDDSIYFIRKCTFPNAAEFSVTFGVIGYGFLVVGCLGYTIRVIHVPFNEILYAD